MANSFSNYVKGSNDNNYFGLYGEYIEEQNISGNYTDVTVDLYIRYENIDMDNATSCTIKINGAETSFTVGAFEDRPGGGGKYKLGSATTRVYHDQDGQKNNVIISATWFPYMTYGGTTYNTLSVSTTVNLTPIPRVSSFTINTTSVNIGENIEITISPASTDFAHAVRIYINDSYSVRTTLGVNVKTCEITVPSSWADYLSSSSSCTAYCNVATYNGSSSNEDNYIGYEKKSFTITIPDTDTYHPQIGTFEVTVSPITTNNGTSNELVQNKNTVTASVTGSSAAAGSDIVSYTFSCLSGTKIIATKTTTSNTAVLGPFSQTGTLEFKVTVTDSRSNSVASTTSKKLTCYAYSPPSFKSFTAYRSDSSGTQDDSGGYANCEYDISYSSVNNTNNLTLRIAYKSGENGYVSTEAFSKQTETSGNYVLGDVDSNTAYTIYATITDNYGGTASSDTVTVFGSFRVFNITSDGTGIALGKLATETEILDSRWPIRSDDPAGTMYNLTNKAYNNIESDVDKANTWTSAGNLATVFVSSNVKPDSFPSSINSSLVVSFTNNDISSTNHAVSQLLSAYGATGELYHRSGYGNNSMGIWHKILMDSDIPNYSNLFPDVLYTNENGYNGTVSLSDSAANYKYLEIFYCDQYGYGHNSIKVYSPNKAKDGTIGKTIDLSLVQQLSDVGDTYIIRTRYTISEKSITPNTKNTGLIKIKGSNTSGDYFEAESVETFAGGNYIYITRVLGWNHD